MKKILLRLKQSDPFYAAVLLASGILAYLLLINRLGFYGDDWYLIFDAHTQGPAFFKVVFSIDRPARAVLMSMVYSLFGDHLLYYHLSAFLFRYLGALSFFWTLNLVWKRNKFPNFLMALFFLLYPGFLMQVQPVDYQSHILSMSLGMISIAFTTRAVSVKGLAQKIIFSLAAILTGWCYLALIEFHIGLEFTRFLFVFLLFWQENDRSVKQRVIRTILNWLPFVVIPLGFLAWRTFIFHNIRAATDVGLQLGAFFQSPLRVGTQWLINTLFGGFNTTVSAWVYPFVDTVIQGGFRLRDMLQIIAVGGAVLLVVMLGLWVARSDQTEQAAGQGWRRQAILASLAAVVAGVLPIIVSNRTVDFSNSRYLMAAAPGAVMLLVAGINLLRSTRVQAAVICLLAFICGSTHFGNALEHVYQADSLRDFWWQVSWRAPQIQSGTTLVASYAAMDAPEEYVIWGPANLIYYPQKQETIPVRIQLPAAIPASETVNLILGGGSGGVVDRRGNLIDVGFNSMLVMTQADPGSCVRILDGSIPELSLLDKEAIKLIAAYSRIERILPDEASRTPPESIFGPEPEHTWCFYYEKASLARQAGDWQSVIALGEEARSNGFSPLDRIEWMPFLQAYVATRQMEALDAYPGVMNEYPLVRYQTCRVLAATAATTNPGDTTLMDYIDEKFCVYTPLK